MHFHTYIVSSYCTDHKRKFADIAQVDCRQHCDTLTPATSKNDTEDSNPFDDTLCSDTDLDTCDDCSSGVYNLSDDGFDYDGDGLCDAGDGDKDKLVKNCLISSKRIQKFLN